MGRPREFDEEEVLDRAVEAFWAHGYEATSITDLEAATGLAKGSLYKAFEGKHALFARALDRYLTDGIGRMKACVDGAGSGAAGLEAWLNAIARMATRGAVRKGCFAVNCTVELAPSDPEIRARLVRHERDGERVYADAIRKGISKGDFRADVDPESAARFVNGMIHGMQVMGKSSLRAGEAQRLVQLTLRALK